MSILGLNRYVIPTTYDIIIWSGDGDERITEFQDRVMDLLEGLWPWENVRGDLEPDLTLLFAETLENIRDYLEEGADPRRRWINTNYPDEPGLDTFDILDAWVGQITEGGEENLHLQRDFPAHYEFLQKLRKVLERSNNVNCFVKGTQPSHL